MFKQMPNKTDANPPLKGEVAETRMKCVGLTEGYRRMKSDSYQQALELTHAMSGLKLGGDSQKSSSSQRRLGSMACGALYYMRFPRTMDPSLRWNDEFYYVGRGPKADASVGYFIGPLVSYSDTPPSHFVCHLPFQGRVFVFWSHMQLACLKGRGQECLPRKHA
jgi:hypothetical protein